MDVYSRSQTCCRFETKINEHEQLFYIADVRCCVACSFLISRNIHLNLHCHQISSRTIRSKIYCSSSKGEFTDKVRQGMFSREISLIKG